MKTLRAAAGAALLLAVSLPLAAHVIPDDVTIQAYAKPDGQRLHLLVRVPFTALADIIFPTRANGDLDVTALDPLLARAAKTWISDWVDVYEDGTVLPKPDVASTRVSLPFDNSFASYGEAWDHVNGPPLMTSMQIRPEQAMLDVRLDYLTRSEHSSFGIHSRLSRLGVRVVTGLRFVPAGAAMRAYAFQGDPGFFLLDPPVTEAIQRFFVLGFWDLVRGPDYLLFFFCTALLFRRVVPLLPFIVAFTVAYSITLIASAYNLVPDALWFPILFETVIALSIVYLAFEAILQGTPPRFLPAIGFGSGLGYGFGFAFPLRQALQFGGSHRLVSILSFHLGIELGQILVLGLMLPALHLLFRFALAERIGTIFLSALAAHTGWHRMIDRARWLGNAQFQQFQWTAVNPAILRWISEAAILAILSYFVFRTARRHWGGRL